jgi:hypothetical protein
VGHFKHAIKEIRINVASQDPTDYHLLIIATAIEKTCLGSIPLKRTVKMRSEGPTFLRRYDATLLEQVGSISLRIGNHQPPQYIWNVAQMFLDRTYHMDYFWQGNRQFVTQLLNEGRRMDCRERYISRIRLYRRRRRTKSPVLNITSL